MGKRFLLILLLVAICLSAVSCTWQTGQSEEPDEEILEPMISQRKLGYASDLQFDLRNDYLYDRYSN